MCTVGLFQLIFGHILNFLSFLGVLSTVSNDCMIIRVMVPITIIGPQPFFYSAIDGRWLALAPFITVTFVVVVH